ncbi:hypothetical protein [Terricaulis silvestris]|uniref:Protein TolA n=1 Tax=Terricaulis silvestris TaxID=2686094 RepID=A0A6I6MLS3_9CAUL|nr:hypothetical protein [Terricaulis silvestris]QGZ96385.1 hypothetical protein DSM104635_03244 [Terricaulis silvestris]
MRPGVIVSIIGHVGAVMMTLLAWEASSSLPSAGQGIVVPVEIVDVSLESNVRALAEQVEVEGEEQADEISEAVPAPRPVPTPTPPRQRPDQARDSFEDLLRNYDKDRGRRQETGETADTTRPGAGAGTGDTVAIRDRVTALNRRAMMRCWRMPSDLPDPERLNVTLEFDLDRNGNLRGQPRVIRPTNYTFDAPMRAAVENALRAVRSCDFTFFPEDPVVGSRYDAWDELEFTFGLNQPS